MPLEIEAKLQVDSHGPIRANLIARGAEPLGRVLEINHLFDNAERTLLTSDCGLRIRECRDDQGRLSRANMTYKGPETTGRLKRRQEIEFTIDDPAAAAALLEALGFTEVLRFQKRRETWRLGECLVELDELPRLGTYVEVEGPDETCISQVQEKLGLTGAPLVRGSYIALLMRHAEQTGLPAAQITF